MDRSGGCFNCSKEGHTIVGCRTPPHYPVCAIRNLPAGHRAGGEGCVPYNSPKRVIVAAETSDNDRKGDEQGESTVPVSEDVPSTGEGVEVDLSNG